MANPAFDGAINGAMIGATVGSLLYATLKLTKLDRYLGGKSAANTTTANFLPVSPSARTETALIAVMWVMTGVLIVVSMALNKAMAPAFALLDLPAFVIAIILLCKPGAINKANGAAKLGLELLAFFAAFIAASHQPAPMLPPSAPGMPTFPTMPGTPPNFPQTGFPQPGHIVAPPNFRMPPAPQMPQGPFGPH